ncbi:MAG: hypothetical protein DHS20C02_09650 [Micavibrio sp.]|nr:MAG: hypothetical protein DHS20C02_09650 [Micavibrio sp.]
MNYYNAMNYYNKNGDDEDRGVPTVVHVYLTPDPSSTEEGSERYQASLQQLRKLIEGEPIINMGSERNPGEVRLNVYETKTGTPYTTLFYNKDFVSLSRHIPENEQTYIAPCIDEDLAPMGGGHPKNFRAAAIVDISGIDDWKREAVGGTHNDEEEPAQKEELALTL